MRNAHLLVCRAQAGLGIPMCCALPGLTHLAFHGRHELVQTLLKARADASRRSAGGLSALDYCAREGHAECAAVLVRAKGSG